MKEVHQPKSLTLFLPLQVLPDLLSPSNIFYFMTDFQHQLLFFLIFSEHW